MSNRRTVGDLNGKWSILFRAQLVVMSVCIPSLVMLGTWMVYEIFELKGAVREFMAAGPRYTEDMAARDFARAKLETREHAQATAARFSDQLEALRKEVVRMRTEERF